MNFSNNLKLAHIISCSSKGKCFKEEKLQVSKYPSDGLKSSQENNIKEIRDYIENYLYPELCNLPKF